MTKLGFFGRDNTTPPPKRPLARAPIATAIPPDQMKAAQACFNLLQETRDMTSALLDDRLEQRRLDAEQLAETIATRKAVEQLAAKISELLDSATPNNEPG